MLYPSIPSSIKTLCTPLYSMQICLRLRKIINQGRTPPRVQTHRRQMALLTLWPSQCKKLSTNTADRRRQIIKEENLRWISMSLPISKPTNKCHLLRNKYLYYPRLSLIQNRWSKPRKYWTKHPRVVRQSRSCKNTGKRSSLLKTFLTQLSQYFHMRFPSRLINR